jgi:hypothetical protein
MILLAAVGGMATVRAGNRLSKLTREDERDDYYVILRRVFHRTYDDDVTLAAICAIGTGAEEYATGILKISNGYRAFSLFPSASVWSTEYDRFMAGGKETCFDAATNKEISCPPRKREKGLPKSYRGIKTEIKVRALPPDLAMRIGAVWQHRVQEAMQAPPLSDWERGALGGLVHYYFARSSNGDWVAVIGSKGDEKSDAAHMADLVIALQGYSVGAESASELRNALIIVEKKKT